MFQRLILPALLLGGAAAAQDLDDQDRLIRLREKKLAKPFIAHGGWELDYDKARARAKQSGKFVLAYFTRSYSG